MASTIIIGTRVKFDSDHGPQAGTVTGFLKCIANGPRHATIEIDHELAGIVWTMPVSELQAVRRPPLANIDFANLNHMLGTVDTLAGDWGKRNWFSAGAGEQQESMQRLVAAGAVRQGRDSMASQGRIIFHATLYGCKVAGLHQAAIDRAMGI